MDNGGDIMDIPESALHCEQRVLQTGAVTPNNATMQTFLSAIRQERLLIRMVQLAEAQNKMLGNQNRLMGRLAAAPERSNGKPKGEG